jgi:hypothetical protein
MRKGILTGIVTVLFLAGAVGAAMANTINVDFGYKASAIYSGTGAAPDSGTTWNGLDYTGGSNLLDSTGTVTAVGVRTSASEAYSDGGNTLVGDRIYVSGNWTAFDVIITGLNTLATYNLYAYGSNNRFASTYSVDGVSGYSLGDMNDAPFTLNNNYALLSQLGPALNGEIDIRVDRYNGAEAAVIGGFQLVEQSQPVPEPGTMALLGAGMLVLTILGKRRMNKEG